MKETINKLQQSKHTTIDKWLDGTDVKKMLHISESTLWRYRKNRMIPFTKIGNKYVYPESYFMKTVVAKMENSHLL